MNGNFRIGDFLIEPQINSIIGADKTARLEPKVMQVLVCLAQHAGEVLPKEKLIQSVWPDTFVTDDVLTRSISELRKVFEDDPRQPRFIQTIPRSGYRLVATVSYDESTKEQQSDSPEPKPVKSRKHLSWIAGVLGGLLLISVGALYLLHFRRSSDPPRIVNTIQLTNDGRNKNLFQLATDGSRVYFTEDLGQTVGLAQAPATGGEATLIPAPSLEGPGVPVVYDILPGRSELLVANALSGEDPALWLMPAQGGPGRRLGDLRGGFACWSPDGQQIAYARDGDIYIARSDGTEPRKLINSRADGIPQRPSWSPDGSRLRVQMFGNASKMWEVSADGTNLHPLLPGWKLASSVWMGRWTPDGRYYVFLATDPQRGTDDIWAIRETVNFFGKADTEPIQLTSGPMGFGPFVFSPDGKKLYTMGYLPHGELVRYDVTSGHWLPFLSGISANYVDFSKDGEWVTYVTYPDGQLWRSRADGGQRLQLTPPGMEVTVPRWSPDGKQIAFTVQVSGQPSHTYLISAEGGKPERLVQTSCGDADATWSPDGNRLIFAPQPAAPCPAAIHLLELKSGQVSTIPGSDGLFSPRWSPDGKSIVAITVDGSRLMLFSFATQRWEEALKGGISYPGWSRDGRFLYFINANDVLRMRIADHQVEKVTSLTGVSMKFGWWLGLAADDSLLVLRDSTGCELYALDWVAP